MKTPDQVVKQILNLIKASLINIDYANSMCWIFGFTRDDVPAQTSLFFELIKQYEDYQHLYSQIRTAQKKGLIFSVSNIEDNIKKFEQILKHSQNTKYIWQNGPIKVICHDAKLLSIASEIKEKGFVTLSKVESEKCFEFSGVIRFWNRIPSYTTFVLGGGLAVSSPEFDLFESMCWSFNEALTTHRELLALKAQKEKIERSIADYSKILSQHLIMCRQCVINAFLLVEAFINSIAESSLADSQRHFTDDQRMYLQELTRDKQGNVRQKFIPIEEKLYEWTKLISPTGRTFNKGSKTFQEFMKVKEYRNAIVHLSATKIQNYRSINFDIASKSVRLALEVVKQISEYTSPDSKNIEYPFWLTEPQADGLFHISKTLELQEKQLQENHQNPIHAEQKNQPHG